MAVVVTPCVGIFDQNGMWMLDGIFCVGGAHAYSAGGSVSSFCFFLGWTAMSSRSAVYCDAQYQTEST